MDFSSKSSTPDQIPAKMLEQPAESPSAAIARIAVRSTVWVTLGTYLNLLIGFAANLALTRLLGPATFGIFSLALFWSSLLNLRSKLGLNYAAIQQPETDGDLLGTYYVLDLMAAAGSFMLGIIVITWLGWIGYKNELILAIMVLISVESVSALVGPLAMALEKELQLSRLTLVTLIASTVAYVLAISLALKGSGIWSLLAINAVTMLISLGGIYWVCRRRLPQAFHLHWQFNSILARRLLRSGIATGLALTALTSIVTQYDNFLIGTFVGYETLGFYDRAYRIAHWPNILLTMIVSRIGFVTFAKVQHDLPRLTYAVQLSLWILSTLGVPITLLIFFGAPDLVLLLYGPAWNSSAFFLRCLIIYSLIWPFVSMAFWLSVARGHSRTTVLITIFQAIVIVVTATPLTWWWGVIGTMIGVGISMLSAFSMGCYYIFRQVPLAFREAFGPPLLASGVTVIVWLVLIHLPAWNGLQPMARLLITGMTGPIFIISLFIIRPRETIDRVRYLGQIWVNAKSGS